MTTRAIACTAACSEDAAVATASVTGEVAIHDARMVLEVAHVDLQLCGLRGRAAHVVAQQLGLVDEHLGDHLLPQGVLPPVR